MDPAAESTPSIETLFRRWREADDAEALAEVLARTEPELYALARRQARDDSAAWDLVQESWLTVLREARRWDESQRLMPWIVGILQIEARRARRDAARTPDPRRLETPVPAAADAEAPAAEIRVAVEHAVGRLPDLYRDVVSMHLLQDLSHTEIAARTGREPGTVRVQVFRGLAQLRKLVPASLSLGTALAILAPRSEAARLLRVLDGAAGLGSGAASGATATAAQSAGASTPVATGGVFAGAGVAWLLGALAAAVLATGVWIGMSGGADVAESASRGVASNAHEDTHEDASGARARAVETVSPLADPSARTAATSATAATIPAARGVRLVGRVDGLAQLRPAAPTVTVRADGLEPLAFPIEPGERFDLDLSAWFAPETRAPREFVVEYDHPNALPAIRPVLLEPTELASARAAAASSGSRHDIDVRFELRAPIARVHGIATWAEDEPAVGRASAVAALFAADAAGSPAADPDEGVTVHADGTFWLRAARAGSHVLVVAPLAVAPLYGSARPATIAVELAPGEDRDLGRVVLASEERVTGTVTLGPDAAAAGVEPIVRWRAAGARRLVSVHGTALRWDGGRFERAGGEARVERNGSFAIAGLARGAFEIESAWRDRASSSIVAGRAAWESALAVDAPSAGVVVPGPGALTRVAVRAEGVALPRALVEYRPAGGAVVRVRTDDSGQALLVAERAGVLGVRHDGHANFEREYAGPLGASIAVDLIPVRDVGTVVLSGAGVDWNGATCVLVPAAAVGADELASLRRGDVPPELAVERAQVGADGRLLAPVRAGRWWLLLRGPREDREGPLAHALPFVAELEVVAGAPVRVEVALELRGRIRFAPVSARAGAADVGLELVGPDGRTVPLELTSLVLRGDARQGRSATTDRMPFAANATSGLLEPGGYVVTARIGAETRSRAVQVVAGRTTVVELETERDP